MKTAIQVILDEIEMEHNNGVEISQKQLWKTLFKAKSTEKQQIIDAYHDGGEKGFNKFGEDADKYYETTFNDKNNKL